MNHRLAFHAPKRDELSEVTSREAFAGRVCAIAVTQEINAEKSRARFA
jgi:hypothetical protein